MWVGCGWDVGGMWVGCGWDVGGMWVGCGWDVGGMWVGLAAEPTNNNNTDSGDGNK